MPDISYAQVNFSAGEWSPNFRGRMDDKEYEFALSLCLNYIPNQENSLSPRSGMRRCGLSNSGSPVKLLPFRFNYYEPYVSEFTALFLRFWANGFPIFDPRAGQMASVAGNPPTFTLQNPGYTDTPDFIPPTWKNGDVIYIKLNAIADIIAFGHLANRQFLLTIVSRSAGTFTLSDAITGSALTGSLTGLTAATKFYRVITLDTDYAHVDDIRQVAFTAGATQQPMREDSTVTRDGPNHRVSYLQAETSPRSIVSQRLLDGLIKEEFIDGPYFDSPGTDIPVAVSGTTGSITVTLHKYSSLVIYRNTSVTWDGTTYYVSIAALNKNNALPTYPASTPFWASLPIAWNGATTYFLGQTALAAPTNHGVSTVYYSIQAGNTNHQPPNVTWWATTPAAWDNTATYSDGAVVSYSGLNYTSLVGANLGHQPDISPTFWLPVNIENAVHEAYSTVDGWPSKAQFVPGEDEGDPFQNNLGRLMRLKAGPQPWDVRYSYLTNDLVNYKDNIYKALQTALAKIPDQEPTYWEIQIRTILWTWGKITAVTNKYVATVLIKGDDLPDMNPVWEFRLGLYSDSTGWPKCGTYHEGRLWLAGSMPNRFDAGRSNLGYDFTPTAPDGTVADNNALSYTLNAASDESIHAMASTAEGVVLMTSEKEWLVSASNLNDPLTPTSIQAHPVTGFGTTNAEAAHLPSGLAFIQSGRRRLMEFRQFVDMTNYQSRLNALDLTRKCQHLTADGIIEAYYQRIPQPVIWVLPGGIVETTTQTATCPLPGAIIEQTNESSRGKLFGIGYSRTPEISYAAPFSFEHGLEYTTGNITMTTNSLCVQRGARDTAEYLYHGVTQSDDGQCYIEMMEPVFESSPLADSFNTDNTVSKFGMLSQAFFLDSGMTPAGCQIAANGLSATFYGLYNLAGKTVAFTIRGKYVGTVTISATGSVNIPFSSPAFVISDIGRAMDYIVPNSTLLPASFQGFYLDKNGNSGVLEPDGRTIVQGFYGQFGYAYRRRGQMLRPPIAGRNGPSFAKLRQNARIGIYLDAGQEISVGATFDAAVLKPFKLTTPGPNGKIGRTAPTAADFVTGIFRQQVDDDNTFDGNLCWEQTRPVPGGILGVGGFLEITDV